MLSSLVREIPASSLTSREKEILFLVAQGHTNKAIAGMLCLSEKTVRNHITHILCKLRLQRRTQLVRHAWQAGLMGKDEGKES
jgi:two-component system nitrate/nitrite response regulator NarL